jgi:phosphogluconate dehydratase
MLLEALGLMVPGAAFVAPGTPLRDALTRAAAWRAATLAGGAEATGSFAATVIDERSIVNAVTALMATGGSTNHTLHLVAMARAVGHRASPGTTWPRCRRSRRCWRACIPTAAPT